MIQTMETTTFKQTKKVGVAGSFFNQLRGNNTSRPVVGKGATVMHYTDRSCYEVIEVSADGMTAKLEELDARHDSTKPGGMGHQNWILVPTGRFITVSWRHNAWRRRSETVEFTKEFSKQVESRTMTTEERKEIFVDGEITLIPGKTELKVKWSKISILFGSKDYYYDWSF